MWPSYVSVSNIDHQPNMPLNATWDPRQTPAKINEPVKDSYRGPWPQSTVSNIETDSRACSLDPLHRSGDPTHGPEEGPDIAEESLPGWPSDSGSGNTPGCPEVLTSSLTGSCLTTPHTGYNMWRRLASGTNQMNYKGKIPNDIKSLTRQQFLKTYSGKHSTAP